MPKFKHGEKNTKMYNAWSAMKQRCRAKPGSKDYPNYAAKGATICERWLGENGFLNFVEDMGPHPGGGMTLDRIDNSNKHYSKENCRWANRKDQAVNRDKFRNSVSQYRGVSRSKDGKAWVARIRIDKKCFHLGTHKNETDAARAYDIAAFRAYGLNAHLNFPQQTDTIGTGIPKTV